MTEEKFYRLTQPLFSWPDKRQLSREYRDIILAYDVIYNLLFTPEDMRPEDIEVNARAVLGFLGNKIEQVCGPELFQDVPGEQMEFDFMKENHGKV